MLFVNRADGSVTKPQETTGSQVVSTVRSGGSSSLVVATNCDGTVSVWDAALGRRLGVVDLPRLDPAADCQTWVASNGVTAATIRTPGGPLDLIDVPSRTVRPVTMRLPAGAPPFGVVGWTADGHVLLETGSIDNGVTGVLIVDPATGEGRSIPLDGSPYEVTADPHGQWLATGGQDGKLRFVSMADGHLLAPPQIAVDGQVYNVSVSPDGRYVATSGAPGQVKLWDTSTFREVGPDLPAPQGAATARARFAPDGSLVVAYSPDNAALDMKAPLDGTSGGDLRHGAAVWQYPVGRAAWERLACSLVGRPLTPEEWATFLPATAYRPTCA
jgi:WD40 repeat protein